jgi:subtilisin family serine protease
MVGGKWGLVAGSSFAAAHLTGLVALLRELAPNLRPQQIREALAAQAIPSLAGGHRAIVDACAAVARIAGTCACACAVAGDTKSLPPL